MKTHDSAIEQYQNPEKRRDGKKAKRRRGSTVWAAVKNEYEKKGIWVKESE